MLSSGALVGALFSPGTLLATYRGVWAVITCQCNSDSVTGQIRAHLTMLGCWRDNINPSSCCTAAAEVPLCSITFTATSIPFHWPLKTLPKLPEPISAPVHSSVKASTASGGGCTGISCQGS